MAGGVFLELGGLDGNQFSNTLMFEEFLGWRGALLSQLNGTKALKDWCLRHWLSIAVKQDIYMLMLEEFLGWRGAWLVQ